MDKRALACLALLFACGSPDASKQAIGGACAASSDCQTGLTCQTDDPGGQCVKSCANDADCGTGAVCNDEKKCYKACSSDSDCTRGAPYACVGTAPRKFCDAVTPDDGGAGG